MPPLAHGVAGTRHRRLCGSKRLARFLSKGRLAHLSNDGRVCGALPQAHGIADFVSKTLRRLAVEEAGGEEQQQWQAGPEAEGDTLRRRLAEYAAEEAAANAELSRAQRVQQMPQEGFAVIEDPALAKTSGFALLLSQQMSLVQMTRQRVLAARADPADEPAGA